MKNWKPLLVLSICCTAWFACHRDDLNSTGPKVSPIFTGRITDEKGEALYGATVRAGHQTTTTDINGVFRLSNVSLPANNAIVQVSQPGYFEFSRAFFVENGALQPINVQLLKKNLIHSFQSSQSAVAQLDGATLRFPANSIARADGSAYTGPVNVYARYLDPGSPELNNQMPGDLRGINAAGEEQTLASFGMIGAELTTPLGEALNVVAGKDVEISLAIPAEKLAVAPSEIALWHYDTESARWMEEGSAQKSGDRYVGKVGHFSFWNCDYGMPLVQLGGEVFLGNNQTPLSGVTVRLTVVSYGFIGYGTTNNNGYFGGAVPKDETLLLEVVVHDQCGYQAVVSQTIGPFSSDVTLPAIIVPPLTTEFVTISGRLLNCDQQPVSKGYALLEIGGLKQAIGAADDGRFTHTMLLCNHNTLTVSGYDLVSLKKSTSLSYADPAGFIQTGDIQVCTNVDEFITFTLNGQTQNFISPIYVVQDGGVFSVRALNDPYSLSFAVRNSGKTGTFPILEMHYSTTVDPVGAFDVNTTITTFGTLPGGKIIGTFNGTIQRTDGKTDTVSGAYRLNRDN